jgi:heme exporter protein C
VESSQSVAAPAATADQASALQRLVSAPALLVYAAVLLAAGAILGFWYAPTDASTMGFSQKIFYFHVPVAEASFLVLLIAAYFSVRFLMTKRNDYDTKAKVAMEVALVFTTLTMITGVLWTKASWNVWWEWEPRLTTYFIMLLLIIAYFVLRNSIEDDERRATYAAVFAIIAAIDAPISFMITRLIPSNHPVVFTSGFATSNLVPFIVAQIGMLLIGYAIYVMRMSEELLLDRVDEAKTALEG